MASGVFNRFKANLMKGLVDLNGSGAHSVYCGLVTSSYTFNADDNYWTGISTLYETSGTAYVAGGSALTSMTVTQDDSNNLAYFDAADVTWAASTITARFAILYDATLISKDLIVAFDFGSNQSSSNGNFTIQWNASGIISLT